MYRVFFLVIFFIVGFLSSQMVHHFAPGLSLTERFIIYTSIGLILGVAFWLYRQKHGEKHG